MPPPTTPSPTSGVTGDLQTVVAAQQALTVQVGQLIRQLTAGQTALNTALTAITAALTAMSAALAPIAKKYFHIAAAVSALVNTGPTKLYGVAVNNRDITGATFTTLTIYDGTSTGGAVVAAITFRSDVGFNYGDGGLELATGLYVVAAGTPVDLTLIWNAG